MAPEECKAILTIFSSRYLETNSHHLRFRWAVCQIDVLRRISTVEAVRAALSSLPKTLDETYERIFEMIPEEERLIVYRILCLLYANDLLDGRLLGQFKLDVTRLDVHVLLCIVIGDWNHQPGARKQQLFNVNTLEEVCGCLVTVNASKASFAHFTVQEFITSERIFATKKAAVRYFALSSSFAEQLFLRTLLSGICEYAGPLTSHVDPVNDLYDYLVSSGISALMDHTAKISEWQLTRLALPVVEPDGPHFQRVTYISDHIDTRPWISGLYRSLSMEIDS